MVGLFACFLCLYYLSIGKALAWQRKWDTNKKAKIVDYAIKANVEIITTRPSEIYCVKLTSVSTQSCLVLSLTATDSCFIWNKGCSVFLVIGLISKGLYTELPGSTEAIRPSNSSHWQQIQLVRPCEAFKKLQEIRTTLNANLALIHCTDDVILGSRLDHPHHFLNLPTPRQLTCDSVPQRRPQ